MKKIKNSHFIIIAFIAVFVFYLITKTNFKNYISHTFEPKIGDKVENNNENCKHFKSCGVVTDIKDLDNDMGKVIEYRVTNTGATYNKGDVLRKTMDQLCPKNQLPYA